MCTSIESNLEAHVREVLLNGPLPGLGLLNNHSCHDGFVLALLECSLNDLEGGATPGCRSASGTESMNPGADVAAVTASLTASSSLASVGPSHTGVWVTAGGGVVEPGSNAGSGTARKSVGSPWAPVEGGQLVTS